jgi:hypothetical protein
MPELSKLVQFHPYPHVVCCLPSIAAPPALLFGPLHSHGEEIDGSRPCPTCLLHHSLALLLLLLVATTVASGRIRAVAGQAAASFAASGTSPSGRRHPRRRPAERAVVAPPLEALRKEDGFFFAEGQTMNGRGSHQKRSYKGDRTWEG